jgi:hypothetical protein
MRVISDSSVRGRRLVFLDTAAWSYLESSRDPAATAELRKLADAEEIEVAVTLDHLTRRPASGMASDGALGKPNGVTQHNLGRGVIVWRWSTE